MKDILNELKVLNITEEQRVYLKEEVILYGKKCYKQGKHDFAVKLEPIIDEALEDK